MFELGGGSGIGRAVCHVLAREGARVVVSDLNIIAAEQTMKELESIGIHLIPFLSIPLKICLFRWEIRSPCFAYRCVSGPFSTVCHF